MIGENVPFQDKPITKNAVWVALVAQSPEYDQLVDQILMACFKTIELLLIRVIEDQKPAVTAATYS